jgi:crotonobetainyl-CoA:carnitine CoA-transferase CaiB-like acyl-CoA transferase
MPGPLDGIRILEFTEIIAGPFGGMLLSDMGADIIKIEPPWGEPWRFSQPFIPNESRTYISLNRGKRSLPVDLTKPEGLEIIYKMISDIDVVIINARPDVPYNLGIDYETLSAKNPRLIYCENTAFGRKGPHSYRPGYDIVIQAMSGLMASEGKIQDGVAQQIQSTAIADYATGITIAWSVCAALYHRERTGQGQKIEASLLGTALAVQGGRFLQVAVVDDEPRGEFLESLAQLRADGAPYEEVQDRYRQQSAWRRGNVYYRSYQAKDGIVTVGCLSDRLRKRMADALGLYDIRFEPDYDPTSEESIAFAEELVKKAEAVVKQKTVAEWLTLLDGAGVPAGPLRFVEEMVTDDQVIANDLVVELDHSLAGSVKMVGPIFSMSETPLEAKMASPALGEHSQEILEQLGYSLQEIQKLRDNGVIS